MEIRKPLFTEKKLTATNFRPWPWDQSHPVRPVHETDKKMREKMQTLLPRLQKCLNDLDSGQKLIDRAIIKANGGGRREFFNSPAKPAVNRITLVSAYSVASIQVKHTVIGKWHGKPVTVTQALPLDLASALKDTEVLQILLSRLLIGYSHKALVNVEVCSQ